MLQLQGILPSLFPSAWKGFHPLIFYPFPSPLPSSGHHHHLRHSLFPWYVGRNSKFFKNVIFCPKAFVFYLFFYLKTSTNLLGLRQNCFLLDFFLKKYLFIYFWLCWVFVSVRGLSLVVASGGHSSLQCAGLSLSRPLLLRSTGSRRTGSVVVAHGPSCSAACGIFPDQGSNPCPLH